MPPSKYLMARPLCTIIVGAADGSLRNIERWFFHLQQLILPDTMSLS
jgi:hypothetical protein